MHLIRKYDNVWSLPLRLRGTGSSTIFADGAFLPNTVCGYDLSMSYKVAKGLSNFAIFSTTYGHLESAEENTKL